MALRSNAEKVIFSDYIPEEILNNVITKGLEKNEVDLLRDFFEDLDQK
jgi:hypothetical protein